MRGNICYVSANPFLVLLQKKNLAQYARFRKIYRISCENEVTYAYED